MKKWTANGLEYHAEIKYRPDCYSEAVSRHFALPAPEFQNASLFCLLPMQVTETAMYPFCFAYSRPRNIPVPMIFTTFLRHTEVKHSLNYSSLKLFAVNSMTQVHIPFLLFSRTTSVLFDVWYRLIPVHLSQVLFTSMTSLRGQEFWHASSNFRT